MRENLNDLIEDESIYKIKKILNHKNFYSVEENIHVIKNFTTKKERNWFLNIAESVTEDEWDADQRIWWNKKIAHIGQENVNSKTMNTVLDRIKDLFYSEETEWVINGLQTIHRMRPGEKMFTHADNPSGTSSNTNYVQFGMVLYHNGFNGGEIFYNNLGISYKPEAGDLLMHPGSTKYTHSTRKVAPGPNRYVSTAFGYDPLVKDLRDKEMVFRNMISGKENLEDPIKKHLRK